MLRLSRKTLFAVEAVLDIAYHASDQPVQSREITTRQAIPRRYLEQVLQQLVRAKILVGQRGPRGGYRLARERRRITVGQIVRAIHENDPQNEPENWQAPSESRGSENGRSDGSDLGRKIVRPMWETVLADMMGRLDTITVEDLCRKATHEGIESEAAARLDYTI
jgi:Rrf2 family protein